MTSTVFERVGGVAAVRQIVTAFYGRVLDHPALAHHFDSVDLRTLMSHQTIFLTYAMRGAATFADERLEHTHAALGVTPAEFRDMTDLLRATLAEFDLAPGDVEEVVREMRRCERLVVARD